MRKRMKKRWIFLLGLGFLSAAGSTAAVLSSHEGQKNQLTVGENVIRIVETFDPPKELTEGMNVYRKEIVLRNTGNTDTFARVFMEVEDAEIRNNTEYSDDGESWYTPDVYTEHLPAGWIFEKESGCFYYTSVLKPGEETSPLVRYVRTEFPDEESICPYTIMVYAESIQTLQSDGSAFSGERQWEQAWRQFLAVKGEL